ncbi:unnamed protein product [Rotaria sp. Silwood1]|nr:unnamed protein product [Rotaria sp. Silwood1]CAF1652170.1 unnamed protein product [Rotaria sp. Silwood1]
MTQDQRSFNSSVNSSDLRNQQQHHSFLHHPAIPHFGMTVTDATCSLNTINTTIQQPLFNYPGFTTNHHHLPMPMNVTEHDQHSVTSFLSHPANTNMTHHHINHHQQSLNNVTPLDSDNENHFTLVKRKKKKTKIDRVLNETPSSCSSSSSSSVSTANSTSSTNTNSIISNVPAPNPIRIRIKTGNNGEVRVVGNSTEITHEARRFAETRFAFPPFIVKFNQDVDEKRIIKFISSHYFANYDFNLKLAGHRLKGKRDLLLFPNDRDTFLILFNEHNWPSTIESLTYEKILPNHLPAQFSILLRSVPTHLDVPALLASIQNDYPDVINAFRISNKNKLPTTLVRLDIKNINVINDLLNKKFLYVDNIRFAITEYLAPAKVLICSKCFQVGHFRSSCKNPLDFCKFCGAGVDDLNQHKLNCDKKLNCLRCKGEHDANDMRCPIITTYRSALTKSFLTTAGVNDHPQQNQTNQTNYWFNNNDYPVLNKKNSTNHHHCSVNNIASDAGKKIEELFLKMKKIEENLNKLLDLNNNYSDQLIGLQQVVMNHTHDLHLQQIDTSFQRDFINQFVSPLCQVMVEVIPTLVKQNVLNDKTLFCPSLAGLCTKLVNDLPGWANRFLQNEQFKSKLINDHNRKTQHPSDPSTNKKIHPPSSNL